MAITTHLCSLLVFIPVSMLPGPDEVAQKASSNQPVEKTKPEEASDKAPQPIMNDLASGHDYEPAANVPRIPRTAPTNNRDSTRPLLERLSDDPEQRAKELVYLLRNYRISIRTDEWAEATRELMKLGDVALPHLIAELDHTDRDQTIRVVAFTLRAINNPRAVPALIRAIPKALRPPGSGCGVYVRSKELHEFMTSVHCASDADESVLLGRPVDEILSALEHLTSRKIDAKRDELRHVFLEDPADEAEQRSLFAYRQRNWEKWWSDHGTDFLPREELDKWNQASASLGQTGVDSIERAGNAQFGQLFPTGPEVSLGPVREIELSWPGFADAVCAIDLDEHRGVRRFELYDDEGRNFQAVHSGADLIASEFVQELDTCLWTTAKDAWQTIESDVQNGRSILVDREAGRRMLLAASGEQTFLFLTREGGRGIVHLNEFDSDRYTRKIGYRLWNDTEAPESVGLPHADSPSTASWSADHEGRLAAPGSQSLSAWSLNGNKAVAVPSDVREDFFDRETQTQSEFYRSPAFEKWLVENEVTFLFVWADYSPNRKALPEAYLQTIRRLPAVQIFKCRSAMQISPAAFQELSARDVSEFRNSILKSQFSTHRVPGAFESGTASTDSSVFHLTDGTVGLMQITNRHAADGSIEFRYKSIIPGDSTEKR